MDEDNYYWFVSRADDVILSAGYRIGPFEVESALIEHPAVAESAVVSSPDEQRGEVVKAFVVVAQGLPWRGVGKAVTGSCQIGDRALQVSAPDRVCRGIAQDGQWQDSTGGTARPGSGRHNRVTDLIAIGTVQVARLTVSGVSIYRAGTGTS